MRSRQIRRGGFHCSAIFLFGSSLQIRKHRKSCWDRQRLQWHSHDPHRASGTSRFHLPIGLPAFSLAAFRSSSRLDQGVWAEVKVKVGGEHLRLFSEESALGVQATVYNMNARNWIAPSETVEDIEQGKDRAAEHARAYLWKAANLELPSLTVKKSCSV
jgi:hypothetical protein